MPVGQSFGETFAPLHHDDGIVEFGIEVQTLQLVEQVGAGVVEQAVDVDVNHRRSTGPLRRMHPRQHECRRGHRPVDIHRCGNSFGQHSFSGTKRAGEYDDIAGSQLAAQLRTQCDSVFDIRQCRDARPAVNHGAGPVRATAGSAP